MATALTLFTEPDDFEVRADDAPKTADVVELHAATPDAQPENVRARRRARRDARRFARRAPSSPFGLW